MNNYEFYDIVLDRFNLFIVILITSFILHYFLFKHQVKSILDPYFLVVISSVFCLSDIMLLYFTGNISDYILSNYIFTQISFLLGLYFFNVKKISFKIDNEIKQSIFKSYEHNEIAFYFFSFIYLFSQVLIYIIKGIPLFMESRLETFSTGDGAGVLGRVADITSILSLYMFFSIIKVDKLRFSEIPKYIVLFLIFFTFLLSGSKSGFLIVFSVFWSYILFAVIKGKDYSTYLKLLKNNIKRILILSIILVSLIIIVQTNSQVENIEDRVNPFLALVIRFVHSGDVYWYAYPNNVYLRIPSNNGFAALFTDILGFTRLINWEVLPKAIGIILKDIHHPSDVPSGPNARHNVFGLIYFGFYGSVLFSFGIGLILGFVRNKLPYLVKDNILGGFIFTYLFIKISAIDTDPMMTFTYVTNLLFIFPFLYVLYLFFITIIKVSPTCE